MPGNRGLPHELRPVDRCDRDQRQCCQVRGGTARTSGDIRYTGGVFKFNNHRTEAGGRLLIEGLNTLTDTGPDAENNWVVGDGFHLGLPRPEGDLSGTRIVTFAPTNAFIDHVWSAEDRGATPEGFVNNVSLGRLVIEGQQNSRLNFTGPTAAPYALYTEILQLEGGPFGKHCSPATAGAPLPL